MTAYDIVWMSVVGGLALVFLAAAVAHDIRSSRRSSDQSDEIAGLKAERGQLRDLSSNLRTLLDQARSDAESTGEVNAELRGELAQQRREIDLLRETLQSIATRAESLHAYHGEAVAEIRGIVDRAVGNEPANSGQFAAHSGSFGWIPVGERLPTDDDLDDYGNVLVAVESDRQTPWTEAGYLDDDWRWYWDRIDEPIEGATRVTHWMPVPEPPGCEGAPPVRLGPWIAVDDGLPDDPDEMVVVLAGDVPSRGYCRGDVWQSVYGLPMSGVTHWARLPGREGSGVAGGSGGGKDGLQLGAGDVQGLADASEDVLAGPVFAAEPAVDRDPADADGLRERGDGQAATHDKRSEGQGLGIGHPLDSETESNGNLQS